MKYIIATSMFLVACNQEQQSEVLPQPKVVITHKPMFSSEELKSTNPYSFEVLCRQQCQKAFATCIADGVSNGNDRAKDDCQVSLGRYEYTDHECDYSDEENTTLAEKRRMTKDCHQNSLKQMQSCEYDCYRKVDTLYSYQKAAEIEHCIPFGDKKEFYFSYLRWTANKELFPMLKQCQ